MPWISTPFSIALVIIGLLALAIAGTVYRRQHVPGARPLIALALGASVWSLAYAGELSSTDLATGLLWAKVQYLGIGIVPPAWLAFALQYTQSRRSLSFRITLLLALVPLATIVLAWTNEQHHLIWGSIGQSTGAAPSILAITHGPWFWCYIGYSYLCLIAGASLLIRAMIRAPYLYRGQATALVVAIVAPWIGNGLYIANLSPWPNLDLTPFGFTVAGLAVAWSLARFRLLDLVPIARDTVIDSMSDGVLVLDEHNRVVDINSAARRTLSQPNERVIGSTVDELFPEHADLIARYRGTGEIAEETGVGVGAARQVFDLRLTPLVDRLGRYGGRLVVWRDITERKHVDAALQRRVEQLAALKHIGDIAIRITDLTAALQGMSEVAAALFAARLAMILISDQQTPELRAMVGFERDAGPLDVESLNAMLADTPLTQQDLLANNAPILSALDTLALSPALRAFVAAYQMQSILHVPLVIRDAIVGVMMLATDQAGRSFTADEVSLAETIARDVSAAIDNTRLYRSALTARERLSELYQAAHAISRASLDPEQIYAEIHAALIRLMPTEALAIALYDLAAREADYVYLNGTEGRQPGWRASLANSFAGYVLRRNAPVRIDDFGIFPHPEFDFELSGAAPNTASGMAVLLYGSEQALGMLFVQSYAKGAYTEEDAETLQLLAAHAAIALENARRYRQERELAVSAERTRLARELHDSVTQTLYAASLLTEALPAIWQRDAAEGASSLDKVRQLVRGSLAEMRALLFELRPAALLAADLEALLKQLGDVLTGHTRIPVTLSAEGRANLPSDVKIAIYRIAQEAFNNIAKHAHATRVGVRLQATADALLLQVCDDGQGFELAGIPPDRMGLRIMAERAEGIGAQLRIDSVPQRGTEVSISWPAKEAEGSSRARGG
ncbi:MAG TPA: histidine kinase N-terminal 7TM domain-containing protein [Kouleothrix sp.]|uniref:histidine kinase N-terminal 7TM domain-containing protein n=1 Tax=Kouleothrix sp. TaxID=2779161 RepID=UPI002B55723B|nr:histidine kinase N-terminal 7TM domain-containing protein [Kouleothrix sp.]HRC75385.1 histidine kinase N-terminal 7TM domain-containing protein [Kouleothrix sp.]